MTAHPSKSLVETLKIMLHFAGHLPTLELYATLCRQEEVENEKLAEMSIDGMFLTAGAQFECVPTFIKRNSNPCKTSHRRTTLLSNFELSSSRWSRELKRGHVADA